MSRPPSGQVDLSTDQYSWVVRNVTGGLAALSKSKHKEARLREILEGLKNKVEAIQLPADPQALVVLTTNRNEARALQRMAEASIKRLEIDIIPGYQAKGLDDYVARSKEKLATLKSLTEKIGRALA